MYRSLPRMRQSARPARSAARQPGVRRGMLVFPVLLAVLGGPLDALGQHENFILPVDTLEMLLRDREFWIAQFGPNRGPGDRTQRAVLVFTGFMPISVKWAAASRGADSFNNRPRFEVAVYELQKLFLDKDDYVVPPTVVRALPLDEYPRKDAVQTTFRGIDGVLVLLQYWLRDVDQEGVYDRNRIEEDTLYARHFADLNVLTYLVRHADANPGNVLISTAGNARVFAVDNGVSFGEICDRPDDWRRLRTDRLPQGTVERLRAIGAEDLQRALGVLAQFEVRDGQLVQVEPTENLNPGKGVRRANDTIQLGLTTREIGRVHGRLLDLLKDIDEGKYEIF